MRQRCDIICLTLEWPRVWLLFLFLLLLSGCFSDEDSEKPVPITPPIDISGVWVGTWSGYDPDWGRNISGNWEAELDHNGIAVAGTGDITGDVDCTEAIISGSLSKQYVISGKLDRDWCGTNEWVITALSLLNREVSGMWTKSSVGSEGGFTGVQVATPDSPRIRYFYPPGGLPGTVVSVTGERFAEDAANNALDFNGTPATTLQVRDMQRIITEVPASATIGPLMLTTTSGAVTDTGRSVHSFNTAVSHPTPENINSMIELGNYGSKGIAITPNGRRAFVNFNYSVEMIDVTSSEKLGYGAYTDYPTQAIVASPDNKYVYVSTAYEVLVLHAGLNTILSRIPVAGGDTTKDNPQGLAITPDGRNLLVADNRVAGVISVVDIEDETIIGSLSIATNATPYGIAISPDGLFAYVTAHGLNQVKEFSLETYSETNSFDVGVGPTGIAILPDASKLYVSNTTDNTLSVIDLTTGTVSSPISVDNEPKGVAVSPDGVRVYTANYGSSSVSIIDVATDAVAIPPLLLPTYSYPIAVSILPDGYRGYVSNQTSALRQIGGPTTLTVLKSGGGIGFVTSSPAGISCGEQCRAEYTLNTDVTLTAIASSDSTFNSWSGDCYGSTDTITVTMDSGKSCSAYFTSNYTPSSGSSGGGTTNYYCFIATAAYGSYLDPHVEALREFRDEYLLTNAAGRHFVEWYYDNSPPLAEYISQHESVRLAFRVLLTPVVYTVMYPVTALMLLLTGIASLILWKRRYNKSKTNK